LGGWVVGTKNRLDLLEASHSLGYNYVNKVKPGLILFFIVHRQQVKKSRRRDMLLGKSIKSVEVGLLIHHGRDVERHDG
jgi:hypothetical protein